MKKQNMNNLLVNGGKKLVLLALLATSLNAYGNTTGNIAPDKTNAKIEKTEEITPKDQLKTAGQILLTFAVMFGAAVLFGYGESKECERKLEAMKRYAERKAREEQAQQTR